MVDQVRRSSRSVCTNLAEAWRKRRYAAHFTSKLSDAEAEETRVWLEFAFRCGYLSRGVVDQLDDQYDKILAQLVLMISHPKQWTKAFTLICPQCGTLAVNVGADLQIRPRADLKVGPYACATQDVGVQWG